MVTNDLYSDTRDVIHRIIFDSMYGCYKTCSDKTKQNEYFVLSFVHILYEYKKRLSIIGCN